MLGIFLSRGGRRSFIPSVIIIMTGWGMSAHEQALMISSKVCFAWTRDNPIKANIGEQIHALFGYALISAGVLRIVEICFVLNDKPTPSNGAIRVFQHLPPYVRFCYHDVCLLPLISSSFPASRLGRHPLYVSHRRRNAQRRLSRRRSRHLCPLRLLPLLPHLSRHHFPRPLVLQLWPECIAKREQRRRNLRL